MVVHDKPGEATWMMFRRSWEKGVPFHAAVGRSDPHTDLVSIVHFAPLEKKKHAWWPEWKFRGRLKSGDFPDTAVLERVKPP